MQYFDWNKLDVWLHLVEFGVFIIGGLFWIFRRKLHHDAIERFVHSIATNHLPHIYHTLGRIAFKLGLEPEEPPNINFSGKP